MTDAKMLVGSLSSDLFRVASLSQRGSAKAASRFLGEAKRWSRDLENLELSSYITKLAADVSSRDLTDISLASAERYLMYGVLLQNYALRLK